jgi:hypothetical protein
MLTVSESQEWQAAAEWCARRHLAGVEGDPLPSLLSAAVVADIAGDPETFQDAIRAARYALAREESDARERKQA